MTLPSPTVDRAAETACRSFLDELPDRVAEQDRRDVEPEDALGAAWGDPAITVTCGVAMPESFDRFSECQEVNGVGWYVPPEQAEDPGSDVELTTIGIEPAVRLVVPAELRPPAGAMAVVGKAVSATLAQTDPCV